MYVITVPNTVGQCVWTANMSCQMEFPVTEINAGETIIPPRNA